MSEDTPEEQHNKNRRTAILVALIAIPNVLLGGAIAAGSSYYTANAGRSTELEKYSISQRKDIYAKYLSQLNNVSDDAYAIKHALEGSSTQISAPTDFSRARNSLEDNSSKLRELLTELQIVGSTSAVKFGLSIYHNVGGIVMQAAGSATAWDAQPRNTVSLIKVYAVAVENYLKAIDEARTHFVEESRKDIHADG